MDTTIEPNELEKDIGSNSDMPDLGAPLQAPEPERVEVKKDSLEKLLARVDKLEADNKKLIETADKGRVAHWEATHKGEVPTQYYLNVYQDKIITSWEMTQNRVWKDPQGEWQEDQEIEITNEEGETTVLPYIEFVSNTQKVSASLVASTQKGGKTYLEVEVEGGKKLVIDSVFIN